MYINLRVIYKLYKYFVFILAYLFINTYMLLSVVIAYWSLSRKNLGSGLRLFLALLGCCVHTTTDNSAYDMTIHSQVYWSQYSTTMPNTYYLSIIGTTYAHASWVAYLTYALPNLLYRSLPRSVCGIDTSQWCRRGYDGLLRYVLRYFILT